MLMFMYVRNVDVFMGAMCHPNITTESGKNARNVMGNMNVCIVWFINLQVMIKT